MSLLPKIRKWWDAITQRARVHQDVECELQFHIDAYAEDLIRGGMPETEARRTARVELGWTDTQKEKYRESIGLRLFDEVGSDLRLGLRSLWNQPVEFGIRLAMGASRTHILLLAARAALVSSIGGVAAGLSVDLLVGRMLATWMSSGAPTFATLIDVTLLLTLCALAACLLPARRAASIHPIEALRYE
jgi:hypothetical protein